MDVNNIVSDILIVVYVYNTFSFTCPYRSFKYLQFGIEMESVGPIEAEIWAFDPSASEHFGQISTTHISDCAGKKKTKKNTGQFFLRVSPAYQILSKSEMACPMTVLIWRGIAQI